jgi:hypothetical protein
MTDVSSLRFGSAISGLSMATGASPEAIALACSSALGGVAGPGAGLHDARGSLIVRPGCNILMAGLDSASYLAAEQLLLDPVESCSQVLRRLTQCVDGRRLDSAQAAVTDQPENQHQVSQIREQLEMVAHNPQDHIDRNRSIQLLRQPSFTLRAPTPETFRVGVDEISDGSALIYYPEGSLFSRMAGGKANNSWLEHAGHLADALAGADIVFSRPGRIGTTRVRSLSATLYATASNKQLAAALGCGDASVQRLLESCWVLDPGWNGCHFKDTSIQAIEMGCGIYWEIVRDIFDRRKIASSLSFKLTGDSHAELIKGIHDLHVRFSNEIPADYMPFIRHWRMLAYKIQWALFALYGSYESGEGAVPAALYLTEWTVFNHVQVLRNFVEAERKRREQQAKEAMLKKLADGPQTHRQLARRFSRQRRELHEPILEALVSEGAVMRDTEDRYRLAEPASKAPSS